MFAFDWLISQSAETFVLELMMIIFFGLSTFGFFLVGAYSVIDVYRAMREEFEQVKKEKEEVEKVSKTLTKKFTVDAILVKKSEEK